MFVRHISAVVWNLNNRVWMGRHFRRWQHAGHKFGNHWTWQTPFFGSCLWKTIFWKLPLKVVSTQNFWFGSIMQECWELKCIFLYRHCDIYYMTLCPLWSSILCFFFRAPWWSLRRQRLTLLANSVMSLTDGRRICFTIAVSNRLFFSFSILECI